MLCKKPFHSFGCGQCQPCRYNRRRLWTHRLMLESLKHDRSSFLTLTYDAEHLPSGGTLVPRDVQLFLKRLRKAISPIALRYYFVGEYGDQTFRPHYHAALFGLGPEADALIRSVWPFGNIMLGELTLHSAQYIAGYVTKKMTNKNDPRLEGRYPEFARMSLRPGIGATAMKDVALSLENQFGHKYLHDTLDVPPQLKHGGKLLPLGRYLRRKLRHEMGFVNIAGQEDAQKKRATEEFQKLLLMLDFEKKNPSNERSDYEIINQFRINKKAEDSQRLLQFETKSKIFKKRGSI